MVLWLMSHESIAPALTAAAAAAALMMVVMAL
jgi:hypothetical protein